jgi:hypothetical protein
MIVFGVRNKALITESISIACPICKESDCLQITVRQQYVSVFFIPFAPTRKQGTCVCNQCNAVLQPEYMSTDFQDSYRAIKSKIKTPLWCLTGAFLATVGLIVLFVYIKQDSKRVTLMVHNPQKSDIFGIQPKGGSCTLYEVVKIKSDSIYFFANKYQTTDATNISDLYDKGEQGFDRSKFYGILLSKLIQMDNNGEIIDAKRK